VVNPPREYAHQDRISLVFFHMPNHDAVIRCIENRAEHAVKYPPISCSDYFASKYLRSELQKTQVDTSKEVIVSR
jgi:isopenicillin N synthase-like dioxygenase